MSDLADREASLDLDQSWSAGPELPFLRPQEVHVWRVGLDLDPDRVGELKTLLSQDELERAVRFKFDDHRSHFIVARGCLRVILGRYLKSDPTDIEFSYSAQGKPHVLSNNGCDATHFNLSHSGDIALVALRKVGGIGVDVEYMKRGVRDMKIAERFFSEAEVRVLKEVGDDLKKEAFLNCWTRKEAYIKAIGEGLSCPLNQFEVSLAPGDPAALLTVQGDPKAPSKWWMAALHPGRDYIAAVAMAGECENLACWDLGE